MQGKFKYKRRHSLKQINRKIRIKKKTKVLFRKLMRGYEAVEIRGVLLHTDLAQELAEQGDYTRLDVGNVCIAELLDYGTDALAYVINIENTNFKEWHYKTLIKDTAFRG